MSSIQRRFDRSRASANGCCCARFIGMGGGGLACRDVARGHQPAFARWASAWHPSLASHVSDGAGEGNRTLVFSLEGLRFSRNWQTKSTAPGFHVPMVCRGLERSLISGQRVHHFFRRLAGQISKVLILKAPRPQQKVRGLEGNVRYFSEFLWFDRR